MRENVPKSGYLFVYKPAFPNADFSSAVGKAGLVFTMDDEAFISKKNLACSTTKIL